MGVNQEIKVNTNAILACKSEIISIKAEFLTKMNANNIIPISKNTGAVFSDYALMGIESELLNIKKAMTTLFDNTMTFLDVANMAYTGADRNSSFQFKN